MSYNACMEKIDARKLSSAAQEEKRRQAVALRKKGMSHEEIGEIVGVHKGTVCRWTKSYEREGVSAIRAKKRGPQTGTNRRLTQEQEQSLKRLIAEKTPDQLKLPYALWTRKSVQEVIEQRTGLLLPIRTVGEYLKRWGMTPQKPLKKAYEQRPEAVEKWLKDEYPSIKAQAKKEKAEIYWGDETGLRNDSQHERGYAPKGKTPVIHLNAKRESINMISAVTNQGKVRFRLFEGSMNADLLIDFMKRLIKAAERKVILILDNLRVHHAKIVRSWLAEHKELIEVFYLPSYSPELNPDEYLNCDLKAGVHSGKPARNKKQLSKKVIGHMRMLQKKPRRVQKYFEHKKIAYAA